MAIEYVFTGFENASPVEWWIDEQAVTHVALIYDHERCSPNRAVLHWHIQLQGTAGSDVSVELRNFDNIWNGRSGSPLRDETACVVSEDGRTWRTVFGRKTAENYLALSLHMSSERLFLARIEPYRISDLDRFLSGLEGDPLVQIEHVGSTVEGRPLEILRVGHASASHRLFLRARAHPWETGGNWVLEGLVDAMLCDPPPFVLYAMPMANKDGVDRGGSRFNLMGRDLNRNWDVRADDQLAPENAALEAWLEKMQETGRLPSLAIDLHNDASGQLHVSRPTGDCEAYLKRMADLEQALRNHTWFTEGSTGKNFTNPGSFGEGWLARYGINACILELNVQVAAGLGRPPLAADWRRMGRMMRDAFTAYFSA